MLLTAVGARRLVLLGVAVGACSLSEEPTDTVCGAGTVLKDHACVADTGGTSPGGEGSCAGRDCANDAGAAGDAPSAGGTPHAGAGSGGTPNPNGGGTSTAGNDGTSTAGSGGTSTAGNGGTSTAGNGGTSNGGATQQAGAGGTVAGGAGEAGMSGAGGTGETDTVKTAGCGKVFAGTSGAKVTIQTSGVKAPDCAAKLNGVSKCGAWSTPRDYYVYLPQNYDPERPYSLVLQGPGCGGNGTTVYPLDNNMGNTIIRVGLTPGPNSLGHGTNENQGCFDDKEGDDSIDFPFYEKLIDKLSAELCFDKTRVFASGNSSGSTLANELACKYAGDPLRPIRGVLANTGGLPTEPQFSPTCSGKPVAGMWVHEINDTTNPFAGTLAAVDRAMQTNGCTIGSSYVTTQLDNYLIGGGNADSTCKKIKGCPAAYPLVVCALPGNQHGGHDAVVNPGFSTFVQALTP